MKILFTLALSLCLFPASSFAQDAVLETEKELTPEEQSALRFLNASGAAVTLQGMENALRAQYSMFTDGDDELAKKMVDAMDMEGAMLELLPVYADVFTIEEMDSVSELFESEAGRMFVSRSPKLIQKVSVSMNSVMESRMQAIQILVEEAKKAKEASEVQ